MATRTQRGDAPIIDSLAVCDSSKAYELPAAGRASLFGLVVAVVGIAVAALLWKALDLRRSDQGRTAPPSKVTKIVLDRQIVVPADKVYRLSIPAATARPDAAEVLLFHTEPAVPLDSLTFQFSAEFPGGTVFCEAVPGPTGHVTVIVPRGYGSPPPKGECAIRFNESRRQWIELGRWPLQRLPEPVKLIAAAHRDPRLSAKHNGASILFEYHGAKGRFTPMLKVKSLTYETGANSDSSEPFNNGSLYYACQYPRDQVSAAVEVNYAEPVSETTQLVVPKVLLENYQGQPYLHVLHPASVHVPGYGTITVPAQHPLPSPSSTAQNRDVWLSVQTSRENEAVDPNLVDGPIVSRETLVSPNPETLNLRAIHIPIEERKPHNQWRLFGPIRYGSIGPLKIDIRTTFERIHRGFEVTIPIDRGDL